MLRLTRRDSTEILLFQPEHIVYVERGGDGRANLYLTTREMVKVEERVEEIEGLLRGDYAVGPTEFKDAIPGDGLAETETTFEAVVEVEEAADDEAEATPKKRR